MRRTPWLLGAAVALTLPLAGGSRGTSGKDACYLCSGPPLADARPSRAREGDAGSGDQPKSSLLLRPQPEAAHLDNVLKITDRVYSGGEPRDAAALSALREMGIRTIVSVDGARPRAELAAEMGLRYVHIPIGYDGISESAGRSLARLVQEGEGPFYIHCHHGKHRGPAAAAVACVVDGVVSGEQAASILRAAGTSPDYAGLWRDVRQYHPPSAGTPLPELVPVAPVGSMAAAMAGIDRASDHLALCRSQGWQSPAEHPDVAPIHEALLMKEGFAELVRRLETENPFDAPFLQSMRDANAEVELLEGALRSGDTEGAEALFASLRAECKSCHRSYRN